MDWNKKQDLTMDFAVHSHEDDKTTAVITQLVELANLISNHLGSNIDPNEKATNPKKKKVEKVDVVRMAAKPIEQKLTKADHRIKTRDFTGLSISKEDDVDDDGNLEQANPLMAGALLGGVGGQVGGEIAADFFDEKKQANPMSTSEGKALLASLQDAANKLRKFLSTTMVDSAKALKPNDMRPLNK